MNTAHATGRLAALLALLLLAGCGDGVKLGAQVGNSDASSGASADAGGTADTTGTGSGDASVGQTDTAPLEPLQVGMSLTPPKATYSVGDPVKLGSTVTDEDGETVSGISTRWSVSPSDAANQFNSNPPRYRLEKEGEVTIEVCASGAGYRETCRSRDVFVDAAPPEITLDKPEIGTIVDGSKQSKIEVAGRVSDSHGEPRVYVNGTRQSLDDQGNFETTITPRFGVNRIEVVANDAFHETPSRVIREVVWAKHFGEMKVDSQNKKITSNFKNGVALDLGQHFFDDGQPPKSRTVNQETKLITKDLADILKLVIENVDLTSRIPNPAISSSDLKLVVDDVQLNKPGISIQVTDTGLDMQLQLNGLNVSTSGFLELEGQRLSLTGSVSGRASAVAELDVRRKQNGKFAADVDRLDISVDRLIPNFSSKRANAVFTLAESTLRSQLESRLADALRTELVSTVPSLITDALNSIRDALSEQSFSFDNAITGKQTIAFNGSIRKFNAKFRRSIRTLVAAELSTTGKDAHPKAPGIPMLAPSQAPPSLFDQGRIQIGVRLGVLNGLLTSLWKSGLLEIDLAEVESVDIPGGGTLSGTLPPVLRPAHEAETYDFILEAGQILVETSLLNSKSTFGISLRVGVDVQIQNNKISLKIPPKPDLTTWVVDSPEGRSPPIGPKQIRTLILTNVWPRLQKAIRGGLSFELPIPQFSQLSQLAPTLSNLTLALTRERPMAMRNGYILFDTTIQGRLPLGGSP